MLHILIVEDEAGIARRVERLTHDILGNRIDKLVLINKLAAAQDYIHSNPIDLRLLDLNLSGTNGFEMLRSVVAESFSTIVISAYRDRALEAFEYGVLDFVPKPFDRDRLEKAFQRVLDRTLRSQHPGKYLAVKKAGRIQLIPVSDILFIQGANIYSEIHLNNGRRELSDKTMESLYQILPPWFARIHKSYIANMQTAKEIHISPGAKYELELQEGTRLPIGRTRYTDLRNQFFS